MHREQIAVSGAPACESARLEIGYLEASDRLRLVTLHDEASTGTFARVFGGEVVLGEMRTPVAIKVQRDMALGQKHDGDSSTTKFHREWWLHRLLQKGVSPSELDVRHVARQLEAWPFRESLPPSILCRHARYALTPRCPRSECEGAELQEAWAGKDHERRLVCPHCQAEYAESDKRRIRDGTVGRDPACEGCPHREGTHDVCRSSADLLNVFSAKVLLVERLDLDLDDYLSWDRLRVCPPGRELAWELYSQHRAQVAEEIARLPTNVQGFARLNRLAALFDNILAGAETLFKSCIIHRDLKPANICLRFHGPEVTAKVIDLGLADGPGLPAELRADAAVAQSDPFLPPECAEPTFRLGPVWAAFDETRCIANLDSDQQMSVGTQVLPGDLLYFLDPDLRDRRYRVLRTEPIAPSGRRVWAMVDRGDVWLGPELPLFTLDGSVVRCTEAMVELHRGFPADIFSLGMILLALLQESPNVQTLRNALPNVQRCLETEAQRLEAMPSRAIVEFLRGRKDPYLAEYKECDRRFRRFGPVAQQLADELQGIALRACLRGPHLFYLPHRGAAVGTAFKKLRTDFDTVRQALVRAMNGAAEDFQRTQRSAALQAIRNEAKQHPARRTVGGLRTEDVTASVALSQTDPERVKIETRYLLSVVGSAATLIPYLEALEKTAPENKDAKVSEMELIHYCLKADLTLPDVKLLRKNQKRFDRELLLPTDNDPNSPQGRRAAGIRAWLDTYGGIATQLHSMIEVRHQAADTLDQLAQLTSEVTDREKRRTSWLTPVRFALSWDRERYDCYRTAIFNLSELAQELLGEFAAAEKEYKHQKETFTAALEAWQLMTVKRSNGLGQMERAAKRMWKRIEQMQAKWREHRQHLMLTLEMLLDVYAQLTAMADMEFGRSGWIGKERDRVTVWVPEELADRLAKWDLPELVESLRAPSIAPAFSLAVEFANRRANDLVGGIA